MKDSVLEQKFEDIQDIMRIHRLVKENSLDPLQTDHILSFDFDIFVLRLGK